VKAARCAAALSASLLLTLSPLHSPPAAAAAAPGSGSGGGGGGGGGGGAVMTTLATMAARVPERSVPFSEVASHDTQDACYMVGACTS
jgi:hypothetical protein